MCYSNYFGNNCSEKCIDKSCNISCVCNNATLCNGSNVCQNDITIANQVTFSSVSLGFSANLEILNGSVDILSSEIVTGKDVFISNSNIQFNSSSITAEGCINITNSNITIDLSNSKVGGKISVLNSTSGCLNGSYELSFFNQTKCTLSNAVKNSYVLTIFVVPDESCVAGTPQPIGTWIIVLIVVIAAALVLVLTFIILALTVEKIRFKIFPRLKARKTVTKRSLNVEINSARSTDIMNSGRSTDIGSSGRST